jgi:SAM-dependent methyltransferase
VRHRRLLRALITQQPAAHYVGLDPDPRILAIARRGLSGLDQDLEVVNGYAQDLSFGDDRFDLVVSTLVFHHMPDRAKRAALREVTRVLRPTGRFLLVDFGQPATWMSRALLMIGSLFDGRRNMRANLAGELPVMLSDAELDVTELRPPFRGVRYLLARPKSPARSDGA